LTTSKRDVMLNALEGLKLVWRSSPRLFVLSSVLQGLSGILPVLLLLLIKHILDGSLELARTGDATLNSPVTVWVAATMLVAVAAIALRSWGDIVTEIQRQTLTDEVQERIHAKSKDLDLGYYETPDFYDVFHRVQQEAAFRPSHIVSAVFASARNAIAMGGLAVLLTGLHWACIPLLVLAAVPGLLRRTKWSRLSYAWHREHSPTERKALYYDWVLTKRDYAKELRSFRLFPFFRAGFSELRALLRREKLAMARGRALAELVAGAGPTLVVFGFVLYMVKRTAGGALSIGGLAMYVHAFQRTLTTQHGLLGSLAGLYENSMFLGSYTEFMGLEPTIVRPATPHVLPPRLSRGIRFEDVRFSYPTSSNEALKGVSLSLPAGKSTAIVGRNGSGKSTLIKLLCRLYDPTAGHITADGVDIRCVDPPAWRERLGVLYQDYARFHLSAGDNIRLGDLSIPPGDARIEAAAARAGADKAVKLLHAGYDTLLGKWFRHSDDLSDGEWQKIALARVFLSDAEFLVMDEPTSAIDPKSEARIFDELIGPDRDRSLVLVSHRLAAVRDADCIYVLDGGRVVEEGRHDTLMGRKGLYCELFSAQAHRYRI
jgi:ATP-binding cassette, subfamily B, bacterial